VKKTVCIRGALAFLAVVLAFSGTVAFADDVISSDILLSILEAREDSLKNTPVQGKFLYEWNWISKDNLFDDLFEGPLQQGEIRFPPHRYYLIDYAREGEKVYCSQEVYWPSRPIIGGATPANRQLACSYDGESIVTYDNNNKSVAIRKNSSCLTSYAGFVKLDQFGFSALGIPLSDWLRAALLNTASVDSSTMEVDGESCTRVLWATNDATRTITTVLTLNTSKGYAVTEVRITDSSGKQLSALSEVKLKEFDNGFWFPIHARVTSTDVEQIFDAVELSMGQSIPDDVFQMRAPAPGALLFDETLGRSFMIPK